MPDAENTGKHQEIEIGPVSERGGRDCPCSVLFWFCCSSSPPGAAHPRRCVLPPATRPASGAASPRSPRHSESPAPRIPGAGRCVPQVLRASRPGHRVPAPLLRVAGCPPTPRKSWSPGSRGPRVLCHLPWGASAPSDLLRGPQGPKAAPDSIAAL